MPGKVVAKYRDLYSKGGKVIHRTELTCETVYTIISRYQSVLRGLYNFYCMTVNVSRRMDRIKWILEKSLLKTLAHKLKRSVAKVRKMYTAEILGTKVLQETVERPGKNPLVATFGGIPFTRKPEGMGIRDFVFRVAWFSHTNKRSEVVQRLLAGKCELCKVEHEPLEVHHIRQLKDIDRPGRRPKEPWEKIMAARKRKTLVVCRSCHGTITYGYHDGPRL